MSEPEKTFEQALDEAHAYAMELEPGDAKHLNLKITRDGLLRLVDHARKVHISWAWSLEDGVLTVRVLTN